MNIQPRFLSRPFAGTALLAGACVLLCSFPTSAKAAGSGISASVDANGRIVFVNNGVDDTPEPQGAQSSPGRNVIASTKTLSAPLADATGEAGSAQPRNDASQTEEEPASVAPAPAVIGRDNLDSLIEQTANNYAVDPDLVRAIVKVESNYNPNAVSPRGARGLMQLIPSTGLRFGVRNLFDPQSNLEGGVRYLKYLMDQYKGDLRLTLAAYNAGEDAVASTGGVPPYRETRDYLRRIFDLYPPRSVVLRPPPDPTIVKFVAGDGTVNFSNTDWP